MKFNIGAGFLATLSTLAIDVLAYAARLAMLPYGLDSNVTQLLANLLTKPSVFYLPNVSCNLVSVKLLLLCLRLPKTSVLTTSSSGHSKITCWTVRGASLHHLHRGRGLRISLPKRKEWVARVWRSMNLFSTIPSLLKLQLLMWGPIAGFDCYRNWLHSFHISSHSLLMCSRIIGYQSVYGTQINSGTPTSVRFATASTNTLPWMPLWPAVHIITTSSPATWLCIINEVANT